MRCIISSATKTETYDNLRSVIISTPSGRAEIRNGHAEYFTNLTAGEVIVSTMSKKVNKVLVPESVCHVKDDVVTIIV